MLYATWHLFGAIPGSFVPQEDQGYLLAAVIMPDGASLDRTEAVSRRAAEIFAEEPAVKDYSAPPGYSLLDSQYKTNAGTLFIALKDFAERQGEGCRPSRYSTIPSPSCGRSRKGSSCP